MISAARSTTCRNASGIHCGSAEPRKVHQYHNPAVAIVWWVSLAGGLLYLIPSFLPGRLGNQKAIAWRL